MPSSELQQKPANWYTAEPLRGSGKNGSFKDVDFLSALCITRDTYQAIKDTCIQVLDKQVEDSNLRIDLRRLWKTLDGRLNKAAMLEDLMRAHPETFNDTHRLQHVPNNWNAVKQTLAELCIISANAYRSRRLPRGNMPSRANSSSGTPPPHATEPRPTGDWTTLGLPHTPPNIRCLLLTHCIILDNIVVPVVCGDRRIDILPYRFRKSDAKPDEPQRIQDVSLDRLVTLLAKEFGTDDSPQVWGKNSLGSLVKLESDDHLTVALIFFLPSLWLPDRQQSPGLEVRYAASSIRVTGQL